MIEKLSTQPNTTDNSSELTTKKSYDQPNTTESLSRLKNSTLWTLYNANDIHPLDKEAIEEEFKRREENGIDIYEDEDEDEDENTDNKKKPIGDLVDNSIGWEKKEVLINRGGKANKSAVYQLLYPKLESNSGVPMRYDNGQFRKALSDEQSGKGLKLKPTDKKEEIKFYIDTLTPNPKDVVSLRNANYYDAIEQGQHSQGHFEKDEELFEHITSSPSFVTPKEDSPAKKLELAYVALNGINKLNWFINKPPISLIPASDIDDVLNHVDLIGMIKNEESNSNAFPVAIDLTHAPYKEEIIEKMSWKHMYGATEEFMKKFSEFGIIHENGKVERTDERLRLGLKFPGFASVKYYMDTITPNAPVYKTGRIPMMPKFVINIPYSIIDRLYKEAPKEEDYQEQEDYFKDVKEYLEAIRVARKCTIYECYYQAQDILSMMKELKYKLDKEKQSKLKNEMYYDKDLARIRTGDTYYLSKENIINDALRRIETMVAYLKTSKENYDKKYPEIEAKQKTMIEEEADETIALIKECSHEVYIDRCWDEQQESQPANNAPENQTI